MKQFIILTILYIVIVSIESYFINKYISNHHIEDKNTNVILNKNNSKQEQFICNELKKRLEKLKTMTFQEWLDYNQEKVLLDYEGEKLYIFIYERSTHGDNEEDIMFVRTHVLTEYLNMEASVFQDYSNNSKSAYFSQHDNNIIVGKALFYSKENDDGCSRYSYLWSDPLDNFRPIIKHSVTKKYKKEENGIIREGTISIGYTSNVLLNTIQYYFELLENYFIVILFLIIYLTCIISYYLNKERNKAFILFFILNLFCVFSFLSKDIISNIDFEQQKVDDLNSSILGISFLVVANIFIINKLEAGKKTLFYETSFLFCVSLISLMLAMFKITTYLTQTDVKTHRIQNQILFNMSIIINIFIFLNFFISIFFKKIKFSSKNKIIIEKLNR